MEIEESLFKGSPLESAIRNTQNTKNLHYLITESLENRPNSMFWKEAFEMINKKYKIKKT